jgi:carbon monoxide dehydrogenase subunit G
MRIEGSYDLQAPRDRVWQALLDPDQLSKAMPGCEKLEAVGPDEYTATLKVGVAAVKGTFQGKVRLSDKEPPARYRMAVEGSGGPGFVRGEASMELSEIEGGTRIAYTAEVQVGGLIAGVGQRMVGGVARMLVDQFFSKMAELIGGSA